ncbi:MAG: hypothetical protein QNI96_07145 [Woeseiaceae bacterium]|nr:hypothetical protein [Woeseiaceae bacterium]
MRQQLIEALIYPRLLLQQVIDDHNYHHKNMFEATGERCNHCTGEGCGWDTCMQDFRHFDDMTDEELSVSLREGIKFVEALHKHLRHDETTSTFEYCNWIRNAEHLLEEMEHHLPHVEAAAAHPEH